MKAEDLKRLLRKNGAFFEREGSNHEVWKKGNKTAPVPRHREILESTAKTILKQLGIKK